ncbi:MAG: hypothetical protein LQ351_001806 [Letrouitia transgressa]|nr:MAG: hypothetical protein LQ351_001806 [Letrouitia transgressa]
MVGVAIVQFPATRTISIAPFKDSSFRSWWPRNLGTSASTPLFKRSATYEGIQEDDLMENPSMNPPLGFTAAIGGSTISALASVYFEKILKDTVNPTSLWVRNVQLSFYSLFPALFIGVFYVDGERVAHDGFFAGYNSVVWITVIFQAIGGILFFVGTCAVLLAAYLYSNDGRASSIRIHEYEKITIDKSARWKDSSLKLPATPVTSEGRSSSRPSSPRVGSSRGHFNAKHREE